MQTNREGGLTTALFLVFPPVASGLLLARYSMTATERQKALKTVPAA
jgi:hypothetical protein